MEYVSSGVRGLLIKFHEMNIISFCRLFEDAVSVEVLSVYLSVCLSVHPSIYVSVIPRAFLLTWIVPGCKETLPHIGCAVANFSTKLEIAASHDFFLKVQTAYATNSVNAPRRKVSQCRKSLILSHVGIVLFPFSCSILLSCHVSLLNV
jgi:hypothetical protein